jgi:hypothetical protein
MDNCRNEKPARRYLVKCDQLRKKCDRNPSRRATAKTQRI